MVKIGLFLVNGGWQDLGKSCTICFMVVKLEVKRFVLGHIAHLDQCWILPV